MESLSHFNQRLIAFLDSGKIVLSWVTGISGNRLQAVDSRGRNQSVAPRAVIAMGSSPITRAAFEAEVGSVSAEIEARKREIDTELLWESLLGRGTTWQASDLASEYFGEDGLAARSAMFTAVLEDPVHYKLRGGEFELRTRAQAEEQSESMRRRQEKRESESRLATWLEEVLETDSVPAATPETDEFLTRIRRFLFQAPDADLSNRLSKLGTSEESAREIAFRILQRTGQLPADSDPLLVIAGIDPEFSPSAVEACQALPSYSAEDDRQDLTELRTFTIDDEETIDVDDAISIEPLGDGYRVGIHITDVTWFVGSDGPLFQEAARRVASIYLPTRKVPMLPERLSSDLASLREGELRPCLSFLVEMDGGGGLQRWELKKSQIRVRRRLEYAQADSMMDSPTDDPLALDLCRLLKISQTLREARVAAGAIDLPRPELKIRLDGDDISVETVDQRSPSRRLVAEFMILANTLIAQFAFLRKIPVIYRAQDPPHETLKPPPEGYDPVAYDQIFRKLQRSRLTLQPQGHSGLGVGGYSQATSPIRRLADLITQLQVGACLDRRTLPFSEGELTRILGSAQLIESDLKAVEKRANRYQLLRFVEKYHADTVFDAVLVNRTARAWVAETKQYYLRGRLKLEGEARPGETRRVRVAQVDPERELLVFRLEPGED